MNKDNRSINKNDRGLTINVWPIINNSDIVLDKTKEITINSIEDKKKEKSVNIKA